MKYEDLYDKLLNLNESITSDQLFDEYFKESNDPDIPDGIESTVKILESKGYAVKYSSPGHLNTHFDNDRNKDRVINNKFRTTARVIFSRDYKFSNTPDNWEWKVLNNGDKALYVKPYTYNEKLGSKEEVFKKWQITYLSSLKSWASSLPKSGSNLKNETPDENFNK